MDDASARICPDCRRALVDITRALSWGRIKEREGEEWEEEKNPLFGGDDDADPVERTWECPACGRREYGKQ